MTAESGAPTRSLPLAVALGAGVGLLGGMIGLGGAEFRLPILIGFFGFAALQAVILNKALSLIVVIVALPARLLGISYEEVFSHWPLILNLLAGSLFGAWLGATWAVRMRSEALYRVLAFLLVVIAAVLVFTHAAGVDPSGIDGTRQVLAGIAAGVAIGVIAALLGVAGGELLIPAFVLLYGVDIKIAGSLALAVSLPTMLVAFARYSRDRSFEVLTDHRRFLLAMGLGSVLGVLVGSLLLNVVPGLVLVPLLAVLLVFSAFRVWRHA